MTELEFIKENTTPQERASMLAEECCELAHAALKYRRTMDPDGSPTPVTAMRAAIKLQEEIADVLLCLQVCGYHVVPASEHIANVMDEKRRRWDKRIKDKEAES